MEIYPSIDVRAGKVVRLLQGDYARQINYADDPVKVAEAFENAGATWMHLVDLDGAKTGSPANLYVLTAICRHTTLKVQFGGGMRDESQIARALEHGAGRVIVGTRAIEDWPWFEGLLGRAEFANRVGLGLDARGGEVAVRGWVKASGIQAVDLARRADPLPVAAIVYTDISRDGMLTGPNFEATERLARQTRIPVIASGGVGSLEDIRRLLGTSVHGAIIGRAYYEGRIDLAEAIRLARGAAT
jgi:phosphoribosylformimino-5-aminoimidazole carboxamide ribotide isomerase